MNKWITLLLLVVVIMLGTTSGSAAAAGITCFNIIDEQGNIVFQTGWKVQVGDQCLTPENRRYEVTQVDGLTAHAKYIGTVNLTQAIHKSSPIWAWLNPQIAHAQGGKVAIYHTHSDESYIPTDGKDSI